LVVDDNVSAAQALATYFSLEGMDCEAAFWRRRRCSRRQRFRPRVVFIDIPTPDCEGYQAALALGGDAHTKEAAIVACTAFDEAELR
jgi:two-component system OmpR family response regulator